MVERWTPRWERAVLLDRRQVDDGCAAGMTTRWEKAGWRDRWTTVALLGGSMAVDWEKGRLLGERELCCWAGERWTAVALLSAWERTGLLGGREYDS